jgi:hypothetical protein
MIKRIIRLLYMKWIKRNCKHCCLFCEYKDICLKEEWY